VDDESELEEPAEPTLTDMLAFTADSLDALLTIVVGYRVKAVEAGFSEYSAEAMAVDVHRKLLED
jgi:hypothetical protein